MRHLNNDQKDRFRFKRTDLIFFPVITILLLLTISSSSIHAESEPDFSPNLAVQAPANTTFNVIPSPGTFTADPTARVFTVGGERRLFVYTSTDLRSHDYCPEGTGGGFCMPGYRVFSTTDMKTWNGHGGRLILSAGRSPSRGHDLNKKLSMWAPDVVKKGETYYMFYPHDGYIFVASSDRPQGPFTPLSNTHLVRAIDPSVIQIKTGDHKGWYMYFEQNSRIHVQKLANNFQSLTGESTELPTAKPPKELVEADILGHQEGPFAFFSKGNLWVQYAYSVPADTRGSGYPPFEMNKTCIPSGYQIRQIRLNGDDPLAIGRDDFYGSDRLPDLDNLVIARFDQPTNHGSTVTFKGKTYAFYHKQIGDSPKNHRKAGWSEVTTRSDGSVRTIYPPAVAASNCEDIGKDTPLATTFNNSGPGPGPGPADPPDRRVGQNVQLELATLRGAQVERAAGATRIGFIQRNGTATYSKVTLTGANSVNVRWASNNGPGGILEIYVNNTDAGNRIARVRLDSSGSWNTYKTQNFPISAKNWHKKGKKDLIFRFVPASGGDTVNMYAIDWVRFNR